VGVYKDQHGRKCHPLNGVQWEGSGSGKGPLSSLIPARLQSHGFYWPRKGIPGVQFYLFVPSLSLSLSSLCHTCDHQRCIPALPHWMALPLGRTERKIAC
jgi:hypothetical protein